jgi:hypothetical protein
MYKSHLILNLKIIKLLSLKESLRVEKIKDMQVMDRLLLSSYLLIRHDD